MKPDANQSNQPDPGQGNSGEEPKSLDGEGPGQGFETLIENVRRGDQTAMQELMDSCRDYLLLIANQEFDKELHRKIGPSDIVQNTMLTVHQHVEEFKGEKREQFMAWIRKILLRDLQQVRRELKGTAKRNTNLERPIDGDSQLGQNAIPLSDKNVTPHTNALRSEEREMVNRAMERLSEDFRNVIMMRNSEQLSFAEIGERLNRSADAAQKLWTRAIEKLKTELKSLDAL